MAEKGNGDLCADAYNSRNDCTGRRAAPQAALRAAASHAPYEESRRKPAFWNHRLYFAPKGHGFRAPDGLASVRGATVGQLQNTAQSR
ncbi:hypothetical protein [Paraburkholderia azotifigens]|uniref:Uncharacterized protein n=1 Tax=Paraburkholderia azotifigens TaxID=2057004 RepID=A0ABU9R9I7_9BURK|nr:hypothetical protein [Paraburkholderia azotifigens]